MGSFKYHPCFWARSQPRKACLLVFRERKFGNAYSACLSELEGLYFIFFFWGGGGGGGRGEGWGTVSFFVNVAVIDNDRETCDICKFYMKI